MHIETALDRYLQQLHADGRSPHTIASARRYGVALAAWLAGESRSDDVRRIGHQDLAAFLASPAARLRPDGQAKSAPTLNVLRSHLKSFFRFLHQAGYIRQDPSRLLRQARCGPRPPKTLSADETGRLLHVLAGGRRPQDARDHALVVLLLGTGIRLGSALALEVGDVDLDRGEILLRCTKNDRPERVFLPPAVEKHLRAYLGDRVSGPVFPARRGARLGARSFHLRFRLWCRAAGIERPASPHALRHTFATRLYVRTGDLLLVKEALGHRSIQSTLVYAQASASRLRAALEGAIAVEMASAESAE